MERQIDYTQVTLSVCYDTVLFPFRVDQLMELLPTIGYVLSDQAERLIPHAGRLDVEGILARKLNIGLSVDTHRQVVGVVAPDAETCVKEFSSLEALLKQRLGVDEQGLSKYHELIADAFIAADGSPLDMWGQQFSESPLVGKLSELVGKDLATYGIRVSPRGSVPNQEKWFDLKVEPSVLSPTDTHYLKLVFRDSERAEVINLAESLDNLILAILEQMES